MDRRLVFAVVLICAALMFVAGAPFVQADTHHLVKGAQGPRASAQSWTYAPTNSGVWHGHIVNVGLRSLVVDVSDVTGGAASSILHQKIRFAAYSSNTIDTQGAIMSRGRVYNITVTPNGPQQTYCDVTDVLVYLPSPIALFTYVVNEATLYVDGSSSYDPDGTVIGWAWDFGDGTTAMGVTANHTFAASGTYTIILTVLDDSGMTGSVTQTVAMGGPDIPPVAAFSLSLSIYTVSVDASASSDDHGIVSYSWNWGDSTNGTGVIATHTYSTSGPKMIELTVTDTAGQTNSASKTIQIGPIMPPSASFTAVVDGSMVRVDASNSVDYYGIVNYSWIWGDSTNGAGRIATHLYAQSGSYNITLTVTSWSGLTGSVSHVVTVVLGSQLVALFTATVTGTTVSVDASGSISDVGIISYAWNFDNLVLATGVTHSHIYVAPDNYTVTLTVTDKLGNTNSSCQVVTVSSGLPPDSYRFFVSGTTYASDGLTPVAGCELTITNIRTGETMIGMQSDEMGFYGCYITPLTANYDDSLLVRATGPSGQTGSATGVVSSAPYVIIDMTLTSPAPSLTKSTIVGGVKFTFATIDANAAWGDVSILLTDGTNFVSWRPLTVDLTGANTLTHAYQSSLLGTLRVCCNVTDLSGNGHINQGDFYTLVVLGGAFSAATTYTTTITYVPSGVEMCYSCFTG